MQRQDQTAKKTVTAVTEVKEVTDKKFTVTITDLYSLPHHAYKSSINHKIYAPGGEHNWVMNFAVALNVNGRPRGRVIVKLTPDECLTSLDTSFQEQLGTLSAPHERIVTAAITAYVKRIAKEACDSWSCSTLPYAYRSEEAMETIRASCMKRKII